MMLNTEEPCQRSHVSLRALSFNVAAILYVTKLGKNKTRHTLTIKTYLLEVLNINNGQLIAK